MGGGGGGARVRNKRSKTLELVIVFLSGFDLFYYGRLAKMKKNKKENVERERRR